MVLAVHEGEEGDEINLNRALRVIQCHNPSLESMLQVYTPVTTAHSYYNMRYQ